MSRRVFIPVSWSWIEHENDVDSAVTHIIVFRLTTLASREDAVARGLLITHEGACGTCSTFQDLVVYITKPDLAEVGTRCAFRTITNFLDGIECYREAGFSDACAATWVYNTNNTRSNCLSPCLQHSSSGLPNNLAAPGCELVECIQCDEDNSGDLFKKFAGRTRRRSGVLSKIVRPCSSVSEILHQDPCDLSSTMEGTDQTSVGHGCKMYFPLTTAILGFVFLAID